MDGQWNEPITVQTRKTGEKMTISNARQASEFMLNEWPTIEAGAAFNAAKEALSQAFDGKLDAREAKEAFLSALIEGEIYVFEK
jgi:hypothetical protein